MVGVTVGELMVMVIVGVGVMLGEQVGVGVRFIRGWRKPAKFL